MKHAGKKERGLGQVTSPLREAGSFTDRGEKQKRVVKKQGKKTETFQKKALPPMGNAQRKTDQRYLQGHHQQTRYHLESRVREGRPPLNKGTS